MSLREIGRRLDIPPSTIVYYKDRFQAHLPHTIGSGRSRRYPEEALAVFASIREMFAKSWPAEQIEAELAANLPESSDAAAPSASASSQRTPDLGGLAEALTGLSEDLTERNALKSEIGALRENLDRIVAAQASLEQNLAVREAKLLERMDELGRQNRRLEEMLAESGQTSPADGPPKSLLSLPLVIKSDQGEYLGVSDGAKSFSLEDFLGVVEKGGKKHRITGMEWGKHQNLWRLTIHSVNAANKKTHEHVLETESLVTPKKNRVMRLASLRIDGQATPQPLLLLLFRKIKDGFAT